MRNPTGDNLPNKLIGEARFEDEIIVASQLARKAGQVIMSMYGKKFTVRQKGDAGPVTDADLRSEEILVEGLQRAFPGDLIISEERTPPVASSPARRVWYVDPLDGTQEFINGQGEFSVLIGLAVSGEPRLGLILWPVDGTQFLGIADHAAWQEAGGARRRLAVSSQADLPKMTLVVSRSHRHRRIESIRTRLGITEELRCGSVGLKVGMVASGQADLYVEPASYTSVWDTCGPEAILRGGGGKLTDLTGAPLTHKATGDLRHAKGLLATNGKCHQQIVEAIGGSVSEGR